MSDPHLDRLLDDLAAEYEALDAIVAGIPDPAWGRPTPAAGWTVVDQVSHLAFFEDRAASAIAEPETFAAELARAVEDLDAYLDEPVTRGRELGGPGTLAWWRRARAATLAAGGELAGDERIPWYGPPMSPRSFLGARLMETWAHGTDVADALGVRLEATNRLRHVAELGVRTFAWSFSNRGLPVPDERVRVELAAPEGGTWTWNDGAGGGTVTGPAEDFCLVVSQRRHRYDTRLVIVGEVAEHWMAIAQCFAGPPGPGRAPTAGESAPGGGG